MFLGGRETEIVPLVFGERFCAILYKNILLDPGSPKMKKSLQKHFSTLSKNAVKYVVATHHHEEHVGNLEVAAAYFGVPLWGSSSTLKILRKYPQLPWARRFAIGQPEDLLMEAQVLEDGKVLGDTGLIAYSAPGHCDDQMVLYDPAEKALLVGDAFMGSYFSTPNPDVDSQKWVESLRRLLELDIDLLIEGHGHVHSLNTNIPDVPGVVIRRDPKQELQEKLEYLLWIRDQIENGISEGFSPKAIEATCFPWTSQRVWENFANDKLVAVLSGGDFSNQELIRSFKRSETDKSIFPEERRIKVYF